jgi:hypothetical protein
MILPGRYRHGLSGIRRDRSRRTRRARCRSSRAFIDFLEEIRRFCRRPNQSAASHAHGTAAREIRTAADHSQRKSRRELRSALLVRVVGARRVRVGSLPGNVVSYAAPSGRDLTQI